MIKNILFAIALILFFEKALYSEVADDLDPVVAPPNFLKLQPHYHLFSQMNLNPGFLTNTPPYFRTTPKLQACLEKVLDKVAGGRSRISSNFGINLVDLTGDKIFNPEFAEFKSTTNLYGASIAKASTLLAAHQLRFDARNVLFDLKEKNINVTEDEVKFYFQKTFEDANPFYHFDHMFVFQKNREAGLGAIDFSESFKERLMKMIRFSDNEQASWCAQAVGFPYIASTLWKLGIYDPKKGGGLWLGRPYGKSFSSWQNDPVGNHSHGVTAISMALYFTLLAQGRLIDKESSESMLNYHTNSHYALKFIEGFNNAGFKVNEAAVKEPDPTKRVIVYRKSGTFEQVSHDATLIKRTVCADETCANYKNYTYVATATAGTMWMTHLLPKLILPLDACILNN